MKKDENVGTYYSRIMDNVGKQRSYGEELTDQKVVEKVLRSLTPKYDYVIPSIEVVFDSDKLTLVKLMGLLQSQEERIIHRSSTDAAIKKQEVQEEQALQVTYDQPKTVFGRGRGRGGFRGRGNGRGRGTLDRSKVPQCFICKKFGHVKKDCWYNQEEPQANVAENEEFGGGNQEEKEENARLFLAFHEDRTEHASLVTCTETSDTESQMWFVDLGCSNHMTGNRGSFSCLDESFSLQVLVIKNVLKLKERDQ
ncbi:uncharacterized protein LOC143565622 [Bidens hawaiensis]|uniref:uncharacterized protein LOC143565622 n=1 Tax=Bidens hawaiensis TaxID=980011 RepID=UPI00404B49EE